MLGDVAGEGGLLVGDHIEPAAERGEEAALFERGAALGGALGQGGLKRCSGAFEGAATMVLVGGVAGGVEILGGFLER